METGNQLINMKKISIGIALLLMILTLSPAQSAPGEWVYTVVDEDNLWNISERYLDTPARFDALRKINNVQFPTRLRPGTKLRIPMKWVRSNPVPATVEKVVGRVFVLRSQDAAEESALPGTAIRLGDRISTAADSSVAIRFADQTLVTVFEDSVARFDHLSAHGTTGMVDSRLNLLQGRMDARVTPASGPGSRFEIHTPSAISAVRGTEYRAAFDDDGTVSRIEVLHGKVEVTGSSKKALVAAGFGTRVQEDKPPLRPRRLLERPAVDPLPERIRQLNWPVVWTANPEASAYRVEIATEDQFATILWQQRGEYARVALPDLPDGSYYLRVRAIDDLGLEGKNTTLALNLDVRPEAPIPLSPSEGKVVRGSTPELQWTTAPDAARYRLEIANDKAFGELLLDVHDVTGSRYETNAFSETGTYYWRLTSIAADGEYGPAGVTRSWEIRPIPEKVAPAIEASDKLLVASWHEAIPGQTYQVQLASDAEFKEVQLDELREEPNIAFEQVVGQVRYLRVRAMAPDGYQGPWGTPQRIDPLPDKSAWWIPGLGILGLLLL